MMRTNSMTRFAAQASTRLPAIIFSVIRATVLVLYRRSPVR